MKRIGINIIKWITDLPLNKQITAILLTACFVIGGVGYALFSRGDTRDAACEADKKELRMSYEIKIAKKDSIIADDQLRIQAVSDRANQEVQEYLKKTNEEMKQQLEDIRNLNHSKNKAYKNNNKIIDKSKIIIDKMKSNVQK